MLEDGTAENVGNSFHVGRGDAASGTAHFLYKVAHGHDEWPPQTRPESVRIERANVEGEPVVLMLATRWGQEALEAFFRFDEADGQIARIRAYGFCPETVQAVGEMLGIPVCTGNLSRSHAGSGRGLARVACRRAICQDRAPWPPSIPSSGSCR